MSKQITMLKRTHFQERIIVTYGGSYKISDPKTTQDKKWNEWIAYGDYLFTKIIGFGLSDLADYMFSDDFENECTVGEMVGNRLEALGDGSDDYSFSDDVLESFYDKLESLQNSAREKGQLRIFDYSSGYPSD